VLTLDGYPHRGQPIMLTEFGGIKLAVGSDRDSPVAWGYSAAEQGAEFLRLFDTLLQTVIHTALFSGFCYTQFADTFQECNGLLTADRQPKVPLEDIAASTSSSRTHIAASV
jgi:hypothetical protein